MKPCQLLASAVLLITLTCADAQSFLKEGAPFSHARKLLLKNGWTPIALHPGAQASDMGTQERMLIKKGIHEVDICSMDAGALCNLFYREDQTCLMITTQGETLKTMRVINWQADSNCAGKS